MKSDDSEKSIWKQPLGEVMKKEMTIPEALKKDITIPEVLKKDINDLPIGDFLRKEIHIRRQVETTADDEVEMVTCTNCGKETPATVANCLHCESPLEGGYKPRKAPKIEEPDTSDEPPISLIDSWEDLNI